MEYKSYIGGIKLTNIKVTDATVKTKRGGFTNRATVDFKIEGSDKTFSIMFYNEETQGVAYILPELRNLGITNPRDTEQLSEDVLAVLEAKGESIDEDVISPEWKEFLKK